MRSDVALREGHPFHVGEGGFQSFPLFRRQGLDVVKDGARCHRRAASFQYKTTPPGM